jgi:dienelactone hydrolase
VAAGQVLVAELNPFAVIANPVANIQLTLELPAIMDRLHAIQHGCLIAAEQYFGTESAISQRINAIADLHVPALAAGAVIAANQVGALKEAPIEIARTGFAGGVSAPHSVVELGLRLQRTASDGTATADEHAEFRLERYGDRVIVYIPGTQKWSPVAGANPLDLTSNVHAMATQTGSAASGSSATEIAASERAVLASLRMAKVGAGDQVLLVGHSQGGIIAANIAAKAHPFKVAGIVTFGSPIAEARVLPGTEVLAIEHTNDPVPMLDAGPNPQRENWVTVKERLDIEPGQSPVAVHDLKGYLETAGRVDASKATRLQSTLDFLRNFAGREAGKTEWFAVRRT